MFSSETRLTVSRSDQIHWPSRAAPLWGDEVFSEDMSKGKGSMRPPSNPRATPVEFEEICKTMGELIASKKVLAWGLSNETAYGVTMFGETCKRLGVPLPITIQNDFCLLVGCWCFSVVSKLSDAQWVTVDVQRFRCSLFRNLRFGSILLI
jgi:aryl-alcohol dehydrogenase-like predicted oxidoreductase